MKTNKVFVDIDGVVAMSQPLEKYSEEGIFKRLPPIRGSHYFLNVLKTICVCSNTEMIALTKTFALDKHDKDADDKKYWIRTMFDPKLFDDILVVHPTENKSKYIDGFSILIDDYGKNCQDWQDNCGIAIQIFETKTKKWATCADYQETLNLVNKILRG